MSFVVKASVESDKDKMEKRCKSEIVKRCVQRPNPGKSDKQLRHRFPYKLRNIFIPDCPEGGVSSPPPPEMKAKKNCTATMKEVCEPRPVLVERLQRVKECKWGNQIN